MATVGTAPRTALDTLSRAVDTAIDAAIAGRVSHRSGTTFIPADVAVPARARRPYVVVHEDGTQELHRNHARTAVVVAGLVLVAAWLISREPA